MSNPRILIIILNWNGWTDTQACLDSVLQLTNVDFTTVVVDNGSATDCPAIEEYGTSHFKQLAVYTKEDIKQATKLPSPAAQSLIVIKNGENLGFAKANNIGIRYAELTGFEYVYLLNNDTIVEPDSLHKLLKVLINSNYAAVVPQIRYYQPADKIWCCGGETKSFYEHYHYKNQLVSHVPQQQQLIDITFATGCALLFKRSVVNRLSEQFFFGEEDFELALRLKKQGQKMACVLNSIIYHKESASIDRSAKYLNKIYVHKLNRLVNIKTYAPVRWPFILIYRSFKFFMLMLLKEKIGFSKAFRNYLLFCRQAFTLKEVNRATFFEILNQKLL